jgi:two-component system, OmpR family, phosphate regulon sensor histidine kinase PhoR
MVDFWIGVVWRVIVLLGASGVVGWIAGPLAGMAVLTVGLTAFVAAQLYYLARLTQWLETPTKRALPDGWGAWEDVFTTLHKRHRTDVAQQQALESGLDQFRAATQALPDGLAILGRGNAIEWCNHAASTHFGIDPVRDRGFLVTNLIRHPDFTEYLIRTDKREPITISTGANPHLKLSVSLLPFQDGRTIVLSRDVTQLMRVDQVRRDFIANVSHEMRTPLTVVHGFLEQMQGDNALPAATRMQFEQLMFAQTSRMKTLVEDLLTLSTLEADDQAPKAEPARVPHAIAQAIESARAVSAGKHAIVMEGELGEHAPDITGNANELQSVFTNLVTNAVRYTPEGGTITVRWGIDQGRATFSVSDTGIGIAPDHIPRLTERFYRVDRSRSRETGGTGLGLAIVKHIVARHGGQLLIASQLGAGSTFTVVFPAVRTLASHLK